MTEPTESSAQIIEQLVAAPIEGALTAPILFFEDASTFAIGGGVGRIQLYAYFNDVGQDGVVTTRKVVVAHLRANLAAFAGLKNAISGMELLAAPTEGGRGN